MVLYTSSVVWHKTNSITKKLVCCVQVCLTVSTRRRLLHVHYCILIFFPAICIAFEKLFMYHKKWLVYKNLLWSCCAVQDDCHLGSQNENAIWKRSKWTVCMMLCIVELCVSLLYGYLWILINSWIFTKSLFYVTSHWVAAAVSLLLH